MSMTRAEFETAVAKIKTAIYGKDVRGAISDSMLFVEEKAQKVLNMLDSITALNSTIEQYGIDIQDLKATDKSTLDEIEFVVNKITMVNSLALGINNTLSSRIDSLNDKVIDLKNELDRDFIYSKNIFDIENAEIFSGYMWTTVAQNNTRVITLNANSGCDAYRIPIRANSTYCTKNLRNFGVFFDSSKNDIVTGGSLNNNGVYVPPSSGIANFITPANAAYIGFTVSSAAVSGHPDMSTFMIVDGETYPETYTAPGTYVAGYNLGKINSDLTKLKRDQINVVRSPNIFNLQVVEKFPGKIWWTGGEFHDNGARDAYRMPITGGKTYCANKIVGNCVYFDSSKKYIDNSLFVPSNPTGVSSFTPPVNAAYFGFTVNASSVDGHPDMSTFMIVEGLIYPDNYSAPGILIEGIDITNLGTQNDVQNSSFAGLTASFYGDSLTEINSRYTKGYHTWIKEKLGLESITNYGVSGYKIASVYNKMNTISNDNSDIIFVMCGLNDQIYETPLGQMGDSGAGSVYGDYDRLCSLVKSKFPTKFVVFITPHYRANSSSTTSSITSYEIAKAMKDVCEKYAIIVYDNFTNSEIYSTNWNYWTSDGTHWTDRAHEMVGKNISRWLLSNFEYVERP